MNPHLRDELVEVIREGMVEETSLERQKVWDTANELSAQLHQLSSVLVLLADAHRLQHEHKEPVAETIWGNAFAFLSTAAEHASDQVEEILRGAFPKPPNAFKTAENT